MSRPSIAERERRPHVFVLVGDCLRSADVTPETMPFTRSFADTVFRRCYAPSTWTLPAFASLYSLSAPDEHGVTRRGHSLSSSQAVLPQLATDNGYRTALFSENPTFSTRYGFHHGIDYTNDFINSKLFPSTVALEHEVEELSLRNCIDGVKTILTAPEGLSAAANAGYAPISYGLSKRSTRYPHHGARVFSHVSKYIDSTATAPLFVVANLLDTHNPHYVAPRPGAEALGVSLSRAEKSALAALSDNKCYLFERPDLPPTDTQDEFSTWDAVFSRRHDVYRTQIRHLDHLIERWISELDPAVRRNSLFIVTGDHGQLFGEEGMVGHHTSLHPGGIQVPLLVKTPELWDEGGIATRAVSWNGLSRALARVVDGKITDGSQFRSAVSEASTRDGPIRVVVDGPTWNVSRLRRRYGSERAEELAVRKVGIIDDNRQRVYESSWDDTRITKTEYELSDGGRDQLSQSADADPSGRTGAWLVAEHSDQADPDVSTRLQQLGYL